MLHKMSGELALPQSSDRTVNSLIIYPEEKNTSRLMSQRKVTFLGQFQSYKPQTKVTGQVNSGNWSSELICPRNSLFLLVCTTGEMERKPI